VLSHPAEARPPARAQAACGRARTDGHASAACLRRQRVGECLYGGNRLVPAHMGIS